MAEVIATFAAISSVLQIIQFSAQLIESTSRVLFEKYKGRSVDEHLDRLAREYGKLNIEEPTLSNEALTAEELAILVQQQRCKSEAEKLLEHLDGMRTTPGLGFGKRVRQEARRAIAAKNERKDIEECRERLCELNGLLGTAILQLLLKKHNEQMRLALNLHHDLQESRAEAMVLRLDEGLKSMHRHILDSLSFQDMSTRYNSIQESYPETYTWTVQKDSHGISTWLRSGNGIFWISGKAGSGKSTLMKFVSQCKDTKALLKLWAGPHARLITASFYFWYLGNTAQKSIEGLLRGILFQIVEHYPDLSPVAFPGLYESIMPPNILSSWSYVQLFEALKVVASHRDAAGLTAKICLFIDGLDEYSGDQSQLIGLMRILAQSLNIKLCLASRPWNAFRNAFESRTPNLQLEKLTYHDIRLYVEGSIRECYSQIGAPLDPTEDDLEDFAIVEVEDIDNDCENHMSGRQRIDQVSRVAYEIVHKAEGVFLWVYLVVQSVLSGLMEGDPLHMLRHRIQELPSDLETFFETILGRVDSVYRHQTLQALKLACLQFDSAGGADRDNVCSWIDFWLISRAPRGLQEPKSLYDTTCQILGQHKLTQMYTETKRFLSASCKDLLWLPEIARHEFEIDRWIKVQFLHRTVYEFLSENRHIREKIDNEVPLIFRNGRVLHLLNLTRLKFNTCNEPLKRRCEAVRRSVNLSLAVDHLDLNREYAGHFESVLAFHCAQCGCNGCSDELLDLHPFDRLDRGMLFALARLVAFGSHQWATSLLAGLSHDYNRIQVGRSPRISDGQPLKMLVHAALGYDTHRPFGIDEIYVPLIEALLTFEESRLDAYGLCNSESGCNSTFWTLFLFKWAMSREPIDANHAWRIAKLFLSKGFSAHDSLCIPLVLPDCGKHKKCDAKTLLDERIPTDWIEREKTEHPCLFGDCGHRESIMLCRNSTLQT